jgi:hypothetical protein
MPLPADMRALALRSALDCAAEALQAGGRGAGHAVALLADARRHASELETALRLPPTRASAPPSPPPLQPRRRFTGHREIGSNVITLRAG